MKRKRKRIPTTPEERAASQAGGQALEERIRLVEAELEAAGSVYAGVPREESLAFAIRRADELAAKKKTA
jgi:hypothetical protein